MQQSFLLGPVFSGAGSFQEKKSLTSGSWVHPGVLILSQQCRPDHEVGPLTVPPIAAWPDSVSCTQG